MAFSLGSQTGPSAQMAGEQSFSKFIFIVSDTFHYFLES
ncbi:hypothetical protein XBP1_2830017 [Xenorhabdus bovienii str. puntauvense]|uniref:Uncharacterized protein n=3 Tax=Xenorhabdus bovienii TaxID=40576 RepID=A0A0B6X7B4_XENBV|nr:hypothetical protein XBFFR1_560039 [Xenorhabdus bovienii str. feltiae France]CDG93319.1 hypothetical protein XBFFL1_2490039 [Xenorhabdus bovienii str. feltiae Florida]CDG97858.1 hypothetical protein XBP1_2830017 [Xenorhabdus bovienii str. puntauvense]CDH24071.1 hypothetical protein XBKB1_2370011 [Xenorhabdus bovienii str. kraussei Becker Underwood]CDM89435.1 protein of unknown function [Xenorhabdus bovienii]